MKVAVVIERYDISLGGAERLVFELVDALSARSIGVSVLAAKGDTVADNVHILCGDQPGKRTSISFFTKALQRHLAENHYDIIHSVVPVGVEDVYQPPGGAFAEAAIRNAASYNNKFIGAYKRLTALANRRRTEMLLAEKCLCKNPDGPIVTALSNYVRDQFKAHYGLEDNRIAIIPNGVCITPKVDTVATENYRQQISQYFKTAPDATPALFLFAANNFRLKGLYPLLQAMSLAKHSNTPRPAGLIVAGSDKPGKWQRLAKQLGVAEKVQFLGSVKNIVDLLPVIDVGILPTFYDPCSRYILEVLAAGKPVITTSFNGSADLFISDRHGKVINTPDNVAALLDTLVYFTDTDNTRKASRAIIDDKLKDKISISRMAQQLEQLYQSIIEKRNAR